MWRIYEDLISAVPDGPVVAECLIGIHWTLVRSEATGMALTPFDRGKAHGSGGFATSGIGRRITGMPVRELAEFIKSWNPFEASLGLAAINSVLNVPARVEKMLDGPLPDRRSQMRFSVQRPLLEREWGIGRFPDSGQLAVFCPDSSQRIRKDDLLTPRAKTCFPNRNLFNQQRLLSSQDSAATSY